RALAACRAGDEAHANQAVHAARGLLSELDAPRLEVDVLLLEAELRALAGDEADAPLELAQKQLEDTRQRHGMVRALAIAARLGAANTRGASRARARELLTSLSAALGPDQEAYLAAYGRGELLRSDKPAPVQTPDTIAGLRELAQRLQDGLALIDARGLASDDSESAQTARRLKQVVSFARAVNSSLDLEMVIDCALSLVIEIAGAERGLLLLKDQNTGVASQRYMAAPGHEDTAAGSEQYSRSVARTVLETGETVCVLDALSDERFAQQASVLGLSLQTIICVPLKDHESIIGAIYVDRQGLSDQFTRADLDIVQALASLTAQALANARLMAAQRERQLHLEMLNRLSRSISRTLELDRVLDLITDMTLEVTGAERAFLFLLENGEPAFGAARDREGPLPPRTALEISRSTVRQVIDTQQGVYVFDAERDDTRISMANLKLGSVLAVPLMGQSGIIGVLYIDSQARLVPTLEREMMVLTAIANTASLAVENARLYRQATVDGLTGLFVRSLFMMRLDEEIRRARRFGTRFSLLVLDIDHFKKFNDTYGHAVGDQVLRHVAQTLRECIRQGLDLPCRYGGEEMVLLLPETDSPGALVTAERIRRAIAEARLPGPNGEALQVTASIGVATFPEMAETGHDLFERADQALYISKHQGRNRCTVYGQS
ncbi:MAG TPA: diguanylate cyclase, partial [Oscillatoriaceae cyanobacterium]